MFKPERFSPADRVLLTCDDDNIGSIRTIEKKGGVLENVVTGPDQLAQAAILDRSGGQSLTHRTEIAICFWPWAPR